MADGKELIETNEIGRELIEPVTTCAVGRENKSRRIRNEEKKLL